MQIIFVFSNKFLLFYIKIDYFCAPKKGFTTIGEAL